MFNRISRFRFSSELPVHGKSHNVHYVPCYIDPSPLNYNQIRSERRGKTATDNIMTDLSLNEHHQELLNRYMQFARYHRAQNMRAMQFAFQDVIDSRLLEVTYTVQEVKEMLTTLSEVVRGDMETELINFTHVNILLVQQLCSQAEKWHLRLQADLDQLQNQELLQKVKAWEEGEDQPFASRRPEKLNPLPNDSTQGPVQLLRLQMDTLRQENTAYQTKISELQAQVDGLEGEGNLLKQNLTEAKLNLETVHQTSSAVQMESQNSHLEEVEHKLSALSSSLVETEQGRQEVEDKLQEANDQLQQVQSQLQLAEMELERKFSETAAYSNMKQMLAKKNEQMKELRKRLQAYEPDDSTGGNE